MYKIILNMNFVKNNKDLFMPFANEVRDIAMKFKNIDIDAKLNNDQEKKYTYMINMIKQYNELFNSSDEDMVDLYDDKWVVFQKSQLLKIKNKYNNNDHNTEKYDKITNQNIDKLKNIHNSIWAHSSKLGDTDILYNTLHTTNNEITVDFDCIFVRNLEDNIKKMIV